MLNVNIKDNRMEFTDVVFCRIFVFCFQRTIKTKTMLTSFSTLLERFINSEESLYRRASRNFSFISLILVSNKCLLSDVWGLLSKMKKK